MITKSLNIDTGYRFTIQRLSSRISHLIITDSRIYPDEDSRSQESWRRNGLIIPLNSDDNIDKLVKLLKNK